MSWFSQQWDKLSRAFDEDHGSANDEASVGIRDLQIIWGRERLCLSLPPSPSPHTLGILKAHLSQQTSLPKDQIKLVYHGLVLRDDDSTLRSYNVRSGARLMMIASVPGGVDSPPADRPGQKRSVYAADEDVGAAGSSSSSGRAPGAGSKGGSGVGRSMTKGEMLAEEKRRKEEDRTEAGVQGRIQEVLDKVKMDVVPKLHSFEARITAATAIPAQSSAIAQGSSSTVAAEISPPSNSSTTASSSAPEASTTAASFTPPASASAAAPPHEESLEQSHRLLNELLSRSLLSLDAIPIVSETTRGKRKGAVKEVQELIDRLDRGWEGIKKDHRRNL